MHISFKFLSVPASITVCVSVLLSSCATTGGMGGGQLGELDYDYRERQIINQGRAVGAIAGAGAGYAIARNNSSSDGSRIAGALAGGLLGGLAGDAVGKAQANKARELRLDNASMANLIASVRADNARLVAYNQKVARRIAEIRRAESEQRAKLAKAELSSVNRAIKETDKLVDRNESDSSQLAGSQRGELDRENRKIKSQRQVLVSHRDELTELASQ